MEDKNPIQVAGRLFDAIELLATSGPMSLKDLSTALELNKSTTHRVLASLIFMGYVRQTPEGDYDLTLKIVDLSERMRLRIDLLSSVRPFLHQLMEECGETVHFVRREGADCVYVEKVEAFQNNVPMISHVGSRIPFYRSAVGKAMAAELSLPEVERLWENTEIKRTTPYTITNYEEFLECLEEVRRKGYALDNEENETGVRCIAASLPLPGPDSAARYAFSVSVPISRMDNDRIRELSIHVLKTKDSICRAING